MKYGKIKDLPDVGKVFLITSVYKSAPSSLHKILSHIIAM